MTLRKKLGKNSIFFRLSAIFSEVAAVTAQEAETADADIPDPDHDPETDAELLVTLLAVDDLVLDQTHVIAVVILDPAHDLVKRGKSRDSFRFAKKKKCTH